MPSPKVTLPDEASPAEDEIQEALAPGSGLIEVPTAAPPGPAPEGVAIPGQSKWPRAKALAYLTSQPKLPVYIPLSRDEEGKTGRFVQEVIWNGWSVLVPKGQTVYAPVSIAEVINQSLERYRTRQARESRAVDMMLITPDNPGGLLVSEYSDPVAVEMYRRGAPLRIDD
jgi:hypothetical protein